MIENYIKSNIKDLLREQEIAKHDFDMIEGIINKNIQSDKIEKWMADYGLFQGVTKKNRFEISNAVKEYFQNYKKDQELFSLEEQFLSLHTTLSNVLNKKWLSATTKLLWLVEPNNIVIYDALVVRSVTVLQCILPALSNLPRINLQPKYKTSSDIIALFKYYNNYQLAVKKIYELNKDVIQNAKFELNSSYSYDLRLMDKLLWRMGDSNSEFILDGIKCRVVKFA